MELKSVRSKCYNLPRFHVYSWNKLDHINANNLQMPIKCSDKWCWWGERWKGVWRQICSAIDRSQLARIPCCLTNYASEHLRTTPAQPTNRPGTNTCLQLYFPITENHWYIIGQVVLDGRDLLCRRTLAWWLPAASSRDHVLIEWKSEKMCSKWEKRGSINKRDVKALSLDAGT